MHPDPLEFLYEYPDRDEREIVGLIAASLAYGRVSQILHSVRAVLDHLGPSPRQFVEGASPGQLRQAFDGFKHRWTTGQEVAELLGGVRRVLVRYGSLREAFVAGLRPEDESVQRALEGFLAELRLGGVCRGNSLVPMVGSTAACKRMHLFLRWMVRRDEVDPGGWDEVPPRLLIVPLDTHMHRLGRALGLSGRRQGDLRTAMEITRAFGPFSGEDPVRYDFSLTRLGIRAELDECEFLRRCGVLTER